MDYDSDSDSNVSVRSESSDSDFELLYENNFSKYNLLKEERTSSVCDFNQDHLKYGEFHTSYNPLRKHEKKFRTYFRMNIDTFDYILSKIKDDITKKCNANSFPSEDRLMVTIKYIFSKHYFFSFNY